MVTQRVVGSVAVGESARTAVRTWDPQQYRRYGGERSRPFFDLTSQIEATQPRSVVDVGCGPGELTASLARRWPQADVLGIDSSPQMIEAAQRVLAEEDAGPGGPPRLRFELMDLLEWSPPEPVDVIVSNAVLQWLPDRDSLMLRFAGHLAEGGWLAVQMPANYGQDAHRLMRELLGSARWQPRLAEVQLAWQSGDPGQYLDLLAKAGYTVNAWETSYLHVLPGEDPVLQWLKGTALRPVLAALDEASRDEFLAEYGALLRDAYPRHEYGIVLPFRRLFVVARR
jgi:trans-aconitate 2-methyltransferase